MNTPEDMLLYELWTVLTSFDTSTVRQLPNTVFIVDAVLCNDHCLVIDSGLDMEITIIYFKKILSLEIRHIIMILFHILTFNWMNFLSIFKNLRILNNSEFWIFFRRRILFLEISDCIIMSSYVRMLILCCLWSRPWDTESLH